MLGLVWYGVGWVWVVVGCWEGVGLVWVTVWVWRGSEEKGVDECEVERRNKVKRSPGSSFGALANQHPEVRASSERAGKWTGLNQHPNSEKISVINQMRETASSKLLRSPRRINTPRCEL